MLKCNSIITYSENAINYYNIINADIFRKLDGTKRERVFKHFQKLVIDNSVASIL